MIASAQAGRLVQGMRVPVLQANARGAKEIVPVQKEIVPARKAIVRGEKETVQDSKASVRLGSADPAGAMETARQTTQFARAMATARAPKRTGRAETSSGRGSAEIANRVTPIAVPMEIAAKANDAPMNGDLVQIRIGRACALAAWVSPEAGVAGTSPCASRKSRSPILAL
jgi:hypothetical protein